MKKIFGKLLFLDAEGRSNFNYDYVTICRGILALMIIWWHLLSGNYRFVVFNFDLTFLIGIPGRVIVWLFILVSGYSIMAGYRKGIYGFTVKEFLRFYFNRLLRILPLYFLTVATYLLFYIYILHSKIPPTAEIIQSILFFDLNFSYGINQMMPTWFIGVLMHLYLLTPILVLIYQAIYKRINFMVGLGLLYVIVYVCNYWGKSLAGSVDVRNVFGVLPLYLFGFVAYDLCHLKIRWDSRFFHIFLIFLSVLLGFISYKYHTAFGNFLNYPGYQYVVGGFGVLLVYFCKQQTASERTQQIQWNWLEKILMSMGVYAYGIYLWHALIIHILMKIGIFDFADKSGYTFIDLLYNFFLVTFLTIVLTIFIYHIFEKQFNRFRLVLTRV
jgi:peptidoglycan/LPS O-acetylase OafA/YrhL